VSQSQDVRNPTVALAAWSLKRPYRNCLPLDMSSTAQASAVEESISILVGRCISASRVEVLEKQKEEIADARCYFLFLLLLKTFSAHTTSLEALSEMLNTSLLINLW
jgi:hypothetical protein